MQTGQRELGYFYYEEPRLGGGGLILQEARHAWQYDVLPALFVPLILMNKSDRTVLKIDSSALNPFSTIMCAGANELLYQPSSNNSFVRSLIFPFTLHFWILEKATRKALKETKLKLVVYSVKIVFSCLCNQEQSSVCMKIIRISPIGSCYLLNVLE